MILRLNFIYLQKILDMNHSELLSVVEEFGSPIYVYDAQKIEDQYLRLTNAFSKVEQKDLAEFIDRGADVVESLITKGLEVTQSTFNS